MRAAPSEAAKKGIIERIYADPDIDSELRSDLKGLVNGESFSITVRQAERMIELRAFAERSVPKGASSEAAELAKRIKSSPFYRDPGERDQSNWMGRGFEQAGDSLTAFLRALLQRNTPDVPNLGAGAISLDWLQFLLWGLLIALVLVFLVFAFRHFQWKSSLERKARALLEDDEPERTRDEYLEEADRLTAEGRFREAVRCLYLACLLVFDEANVARFIRGETNWEHLRRIQSSAALPQDLDFEPATQKFDQVWYGMRIDGVSDVERMRGWYVDISSRLRERAAA